MRVYSLLLRALQAAEEEYLSPAWYQNVGHMCGVTCSPIGCYEGGCKQMTSLRTKREGGLSQGTQQ